MPNLGTWGYVLLIVVLILVALWLVGIRVDLNIG